MAAESTSAGGGLQDTAQTASREIADSKLSAFSIVALRVATGESRVLIPNALHATYTPGYLVYYSSGSLWAAP
jgi:hypothetical protein